MHLGTGSEDEKIRLAEFDYNSDLIEWKNWTWADDGKRVPLFCGLDRQWFHDAMRILI